MTEKYDDVIHARMCIILD